MATSFSDNAFTMLTFIAAPAVLTNASSVLALGTSNRFARSVDRARLLAKQVTEQTEPEDAEAHRVLTVQFERVQRRSMMLLNAMTCFYLALGCFAAAALVSLVGAGLALSIHHRLYVASVGLALLSGFVGVGSMVSGSVLLVRETHLALVNLGEERELVRAQVRRIRSRVESDNLEDTGG